MEVLLKYHKMLQFYIGSMSCTLLNPYNQQLCILFQNIFVASVNRMVVFSLMRTPKCLMPRPVIKILKEWTSS